MQFRNGFSLLIIIIAISLTQTYGQDKKILVNYEMYISAGILLKKEGQLISNGKLSSYKTAGNLDKERATMPEEGKILIESKSGATYNFTNLDKGKIISTSYLLKKVYKIHENVTPIEWKLISGESKMINDFKVLKATGKFRGRDYIAWYSPDIPMRAGPWKFNGLPGLILEISDTSKMFSWVATEIKYPYVDNMPIEEPKDKNLIDIAFKDFVELGQAHHSNEVSKLHARTPKGTTIVSSSTQRGVELVYEWEEKTEK